MPIALNKLLRATSRSFYLTLRVLPSAIRPQIGLAYLLARTTDTIADTEILPVKKRLEALEKLRARILGQSSAPLSFGELAQNQNSPAEKLLLGKIENSLAVLQKISDEDRKLIRAVLEIITLSVFVPFAVFYMHQPFKLDFVWMELCLVGAVCFMFRS